MFSRRNRRRIAAASKLVLVWCAVLSYGAAAVGLAIPLPADPAKATGEAFPCQDHQCGCRTAEQCRQHCCCFTTDQKRAWAYAHGIAEHRVIAKHCVIADQHDHDHADEPAHDKSCCEKGAGARCASKSRPPASSGVNLISSAKCQGLVSFWMALGIALPFQCDKLVEPSVLEPCGTVAILSVDLLSIFAAPPVPPPRLV